MIIKCINDKDVDGYVTKGNKYEAEITDDGLFKIDVCDDGGIAFLDVDRFEIVVD